jgi:hypothetical protein
VREIFTRSWRWVLAVVILAIAGYFMYTKVYRVYGPNVASVDERLPVAFRKNELVFWSWVGGLTLAAVVATFWLFFRTRALRRALLRDDRAPDEAARPIAAAWDEILARLRTSAGSSAYLVLAPGPGPVAALLAASGLNSDGAAPGEATDPLRGFSTEEGLVVWCGDKVSTTVGFVSRALERLRPGASPLRGIVVIVPAEELEGPSSQAAAASVRTGLKASLQGVSTRCPVYFMVTGMEAVPGFLEFARRMSPELRARGRCGFSLPGEPGLSYPKIAAEFDRFVRWYDVCMLELVSLDPLAQIGNEGLYCLARWFLGMRERLLGLLDTIADAGGDDPLDLLGVYFAATGNVPEQRAYAAGVLRGRVTGDPNSVRWSRSSLEADSSYRRAALVLGAVGAAINLSVWGYILFGLESLGAAGWGMLAATALGWCLSCFLIVRRRRIARI